jgi:hypothetical protein
VPVIARESVPMSSDASPPHDQPGSRGQIAEQHIPGLEVSFVSLPGNAYSHLRLAVAAGIR